MNRAKSFCKLMKEQQPDNLAELVSREIDSCEQIIRKHNSTKHDDRSARNGYNKERIVSINMNQYIEALNRYNEKYKIGIDAGIISYNGNE